MPRHRTRILVSLLAVLPLALRAQGTDAALAARIEPILMRPEFRHALWAMRFYDLGTKQVLYDRNAEALFTPGSTTKLLTEGTLLNVLGADYRFHTKVYRTGTLTNGSLTGDIVLVASGDPNLSQRMQPDGTLAFEDEDHSYDGAPETKAVPGDPLVVIKSLATQVASRVKRLNGRVLVDATLFPEGDRELGTGVVLSPIVVNDNVIDVTVTPAATDGAPMTMHVSPETRYVRFVNEMKTGPVGSRRTVDMYADSTLPNGTHVVKIRGSLPAGSVPILYAYRIPSPSAFAQMVFADALKDAGVQVTAPARKAPVNYSALAASYTDDRVVAEHVSAPQSEEAKVTLKVSQNLHASMGPLLLGSIVGKKDTTRTGFDIEREFLTSAGLDVSGAHQGDGAGGDAHFSPAFMVSFLEYMSQRPFFAQFHKALPILGKDGTLFDIQSTSPAAGHVFAKTGTYVVGDPLNRKPLVTGKGFAGYITTADGRELAFAIYVNNVHVPDDPEAVKRVVGQVLGEIAAAAYRR
ncbi:MAG: D-alanyl-D-alanine carboxypeptidase/D-alanyl-D-alanine-endopeptidase [Gemmatimonadaceae bacterium]